MFYSSTVFMYILYGLGHEGIMFQLGFINKCYVNKTHDVFSYMRPGVLDISIGNITLLAAPIPCM